MASSHIEKELYQDQPDSTGIVIAYSPASGFSAIVHSITIVNDSTTASVTFNLYISDSTTTFTAVHLIKKEVSLSPAESFDWETAKGISSDSGGIGVQTSLADTLVFTIHGAEFEVL